MKLNVFLRMACQGHTILTAILIAAATTLSTSCSSSSDTESKTTETESKAESKTIKATSTEFTSGELAKYIEIANEVGELSFVQKDKEKTFLLKVTLGLTKENEELEDIAPQDINCGNLHIYLYDDYDMKVGDYSLSLSLRDRDKLKLSKLLQGEVGDTAVVVFEDNVRYEKDAPDWYKSATMFAPSGTGDIRITGVASSTEDGDTAEVEEDNSSSSSVTSSTKDSKTAAVASGSNSSSSSDVEALLDSYEKYVNKYIALMKKAADGDLSAMVEYGSLYTQAADLSEKLENLEGNMTASDLIRYNEISMKLINAAQ